MSLEFLTALFVVLALAAELRIRVLRRRIAKLEKLLKANNEAIARALAASTTRRLRAIDGPAPKSTGKPPLSVARINW